MTTIIAIYLCCTSLQPMLNPLVGALRLLAYLAKSIYNKWLSQPTILYNTIYEQSPLICGAARGLTINTSAVWRPPGGSLEQLRV